MKTLLLIVAISAVSLFALGQETAWKPAPGHVTLDLWPQGAPGAPANPLPEGDTTTAKDHLTAGKPVIRIGNVSRPTITLYQAASDPDGKAVVVFPGGGYRILAIDLEGTEYAIG